MADPVDLLEREVERSGTDPDPAKLIAWEAAYAAYGPFNGNVLGDPTIDSIWPPVHP